MKTEKQIREQLNDISESNDVGYDYRQTYINALNWVLEEE